GDAERLRRAGGVSRTVGEGRRSPSSGLPAYGTVSVVGERLRVGASTRAEGEREGLQSPAHWDATAFVGLGRSRASKHVGGKGGFSSVSLRVGARDVCKERWKRGGAARWGASQRIGLSKALRLGSWSRVAFR